ncbi:MFS transporter [Amycolatopsis antarctica]|uniref:MFS transporter n=1 Tax=Amycolatopsis antarctica TaxID=1854586 RepID=A0A263D107_9PSEU|nr:MFS transporter [Amycolatopsis antarctica]OZM71899.1 MFS transporter [Amycolatopsis antarctica]
MTLSGARGDSASLHRRSLLATVFGNFVEYFDWLAFGLFAPYFAAEFFPSSNPVTSLLGAFAVFAVGMFLRPVGGVVLGIVADRRGRKPALMLSIALMAAGSTVIAVCPTYEQIGIAAPLLLLAARAAQGFSSGGEWPAAVIYLRELAPENKQVRYGSLFSLSAASGAFVASLLGGVLSAWLGPQGMAEWGWRVPFLLGAIFGVALLIARNRLAETPVFQREVRGKESRGSMRRVLTSYRRQVLLVVLFVAGLTAVIGIWTTAVPAMGHRLAPPGQMFWVIVVVTSITVLVQVPLGMLADRVGVPRFLAFTNIGFLLIGPYTYLTIDGDFLTLVLAYGSGVIYMGCLTAVSPKVLGAIFPPEQRTLGVGLPHSLTTAILGGLTPSLATYTDQQGASGWFMAGVVVTVLVGWGAAVVATSRYVPDRALVTDLPARPEHARAAA